MVEFLDGLSKFSGFLSLTKLVEGLVVILGPVGLLKLLELSIDVVSFSFDDVESLVIDFNAAISFLNVLVKGLKEVSHFFVELLAFWRLSKFLVKLAEFLSFSGLAEILQGFSDVLDWLGILDFFPGFLDIFEVFFDLIDAIFINLNFEIVCQGIFGNIGDFNVLSEALIKILELLL